MKDDVSMKDRRILRGPERKQRGCLFCLDSCSRGHWCPHDECPYPEMDGFDKYTDYLKSTGGDTVAELMHNAGITGCYTTRSAPDRP